MWGRFDVEIAQNAVPVGLCAVGPGMRALDFGWYGAGRIVNAYLYMVAAGCQGRQAIAVRCIDMSQRADAVPVYPESTGLCTFHEEYQAFPFHLYGSRDKSVSTGRLHWWDACRLPTCFHPSYRAMCSSLMNCSNFLINRFVLLLSGILFCLYMMPDMPISIIQ